MLELTQVFFFFLIQQIASVIFGLVRAKVLASLTGVAGFGLISQANALVLTLQVIFGVGLGSGFIKLVAEHRKGEDARRLNQLLAAMFYFGLLVSSAGLLFTGLASGVVSGWVFGDGRFGGYVLICAGAATFIFQSLFLLNVCRGLLEWRVYTLAVTLGYALSLILTVALVVGLGVDGGVWALLASQAGNFAIILYLFWRKVRPRYPVSFLAARPGRETAHLLAANIGPLVILQVVASLSSLAVRSLIIQRLGVEQNGLYQLASGISDAYMGLILGILMSYVLPKIAASANRDPAGAHKVQNDGLRLCLFVLAPFLLALLAVREVWIPILYSPAFLAGQGLLAWQFGGDFLRVIRRCLNVDLIPTNRYGYFALDGLLYAGGTLGLSTALLPVLGLSGVVIANLAVNLLLALLAAGYHLRRTSFRLSARNQALLLRISILLAVGFAAAVGISNLALRVAACAAVLALMAFLLPQKGELATLWREIPAMVFRQSAPVQEEEKAADKHG